MGDTANVRCPYCREKITLYVDPDTDGSFIEDCEVCCRPWQVTVHRSGTKLQVEVAPAS